MTGLAEYQRVLFGVGVRNTVADEVRRLGCSRALILSTPPQSSSALDLAATLNDMLAGVFSRAAMHTPVEDTEDALRHVQEINADCLIAIGGGSTTGLPQIVIPTTYAGSEATRIIGQTEDGVKTTLTDRKVLPEVILYDPKLVATLPVGMTVTSALNAMAHAAGALYARDKSEDSNQLAFDGLTSFAKSLPKVLQDPEDLAAREETQRGAWACGAVLGRVGMALHHKLCHTLGGSFDLPHAETHAIIVPHTIHYNAQAVPGLLAPVTDLLGGSSPGMAFWQFAKSLGASLALRDLGLQVQDLGRVAEIATRNPYWNPREVTTDGVRALLEKAWTGEAPGP
jgi:maleylacetate reductase